MIYVVSWFAKLAVRRRGCLNSCLFCVCCELQCIYSVYSVCQDMQLFFLIPVPLERLTPPGACACPYRAQKRGINYTTGAARHARRAHRSTPNFYTVRNASRINCRQPHHVSTV
jgi:hypothetical protein